MVVVERSTVLDLPVAEVFAFVADQDNAPAWQQGLLSVRKTTEGPIGVGTTHAFERKVMGRNALATNVYTRFVPDEVVAFESTSGPVRFHASYTTTAAGSGTKLTARIELIGGRGVSGLLLPLIARSIHKEMKRNLVALKTLLAHPDRRR